MKRILSTIMGLLVLLAANAQNVTTDGLHQPVNVNDVVVTKVAYAVFSSHDSVYVNPQTGQSDTVTIDDGMATYTPEEFEVKMAAKRAAIKKLIERAKARHSAPAITPDQDWNYEGKQERSSAKLYYYTYPSVDADGNPVRLSALMGVPMNTVVDDFADILMGWPWGSLLISDIKIRPSNVVIGCHVTITSNWECPTSYERNTSILGLDNFRTDTGMMLFYTRYDLLRQPCCLVILPDYEGYGLTKDRPHPYLYQELTARQCVDATRYGLALYQQKVTSEEELPLDDDWKTICVGFSQGGSVSLATHKYIETNDLTDELHFAGSVCGDGPYSPVDHLQYYMTDDGSTTYPFIKTSHRKERVSMPIVMPLILKGMLDSNPYMRQYAITDFLTQNFLNTGVIDYIEAKKNPDAKDQYSTGDVNEMFRLIKETGIHNGKQILQKDSLFPFDDGDNVHGNMRFMLTEKCLADFRRLTKGEELQNDFMKDLVKALESNNLTVGWRPQKRIGFYHTTYDTVVPYVNLLKFMERQSELTYYFVNKDDKPSAREGVYPTHTTTDETEADVMIIDTGSTADHVPAGQDFFFFGSVTSPDYQLMKWVLKGK
ncbi:hypothetical protein [Prevotella sp. E2-28]|uniref:hypothetical protein n=1 Tax=Prevotella sp. E2-28 TaxID=2913620 RepID=UPI001ED9D3FC|nr:hypothetical protein [Prevotella sp. E2-28]UKK53271.1 hypothetical protein L6465_11860 [Prevotella sp. E2-28]